MTQWFRVHGEMLNDPKVQNLKGEIYKAWMNMLCIASKNEGDLKSLDHIAFGLRVSKKKAAKLVEQIAQAGLLDAVEGGYFRPHNWDARQYKSDSSAERVAKYRQKKRECNVTSAVTVTAPEQSRAETEQTDDERGEPATSEVGSAVASSAAVELAKKVVEVVGGASGSVPPSYYDAPSRCQKWIDAGWSEDVILASVKQQMAKRGGEPPECIKYFEKGIADSVVRAAAPLPIGNANRSTLHSKEAYREKHSAVAAIDRVFARLYAARGTERQPGDRGAIDADVVLSLPPGSIHRP